MPKQPKKKLDFSQNALRIVLEATGQAEKTVPPQKDQAAVKRGRLGGLKGGKARAQKLSAERRKEIARKAIAKRWQGQAK